MKIIDEYRRLTEEIAVVKSQITTSKRELKKAMDVYRPADISGIDYSKEPIQTSMKEIPVLIAANNICEINNQIQNYEKELQELYKQRDELEKAINELGDVKKKIMMLRIKGYSLGKIAYTLHYSKRWIEKLNR